VYHHLEHEWQDVCGRYNKIGEIQQKVDLLVVGLQEAPKCDVSQVLQETMADTHILLGQKSMQSLQMLLFGSKSSEKYIREMKVDKHAVGGLGGMIGRKKGAVAMYINLSGIRMVFVSCHLAGWFSISGLCFRLPSVSLVFLKLLPIHYYNASSIRYQYGYTRQPRQ